MISSNLSKRRWDLSRHFVTAEPASSLYSPAFLVMVQLASLEAEAVLLQHLLLQLVAAVLPSQLQIITDLQTISCQQLSKTLKVHLHEIFRF